MNGAKIKPMEEANSGMQMVTFMRENGKMTKRMVMESTFMSTVPSMKDIGKMIFKTAKAWNLGKTEVGMKEDTKKV